MAPRKQKKANKTRRKLNSSLRRHKTYRNRMYGGDIKEDALNIIKATGKTNDIFLFEVLVMEQPKEEGGMWFKKSRRNRFTYVLSASMNKDGPWTEIFEYTDY
jgi:hypothetical protein